MVIFDSTIRRVKPVSRPFALGLSPERPERRAPFTAADLAWAAANLNATARDYTVVGPADSVVAQKAGEAAALDAFEAGYRPF
jgi:hypothetical protein